MELHGSREANLLAQKNFFFDYYFKRYDGHVPFFKWNYFFRADLIVRSKPNSITYNVYTLFPLVFEILSCSRHEWHVLGIACWNRYQPTKGLRQEWQAQKLDNTFSSQMLGTITRPKEDPQEPGSGDTVCRYDDWSESPIWAHF